MTYIQSIILRTILFLTFVAGMLGVSYLAYGDDTDTDGDGIPDSWESGGIDVNEDGLIDFFPLGADPMRKDVFLEIDYMDGHFPGLDVVNQVRAAFENAPVDNPDGSTGITLHIQIDEQLPHKNLASGTDFFDIRTSNFGTESERPDPAFPFIESHTIEAKALIYHYVIFAHQRADDPASSGGFYALNTFVITLGHPVWGDHPVTGHDVGSVDQRAGTLMHELGHSLGLNHGGNQGANCKPNYLSVMSYSRQFSTPIADRPLDYSRSELNALNENFLSEPQGLEASMPAGLTTVHGPQFQIQVAAGQSVDWNQDGDFDDIFLPADVNYMEGIGGCGNSPEQILTGHDDWGNLSYVTEAAQGGGGNAPDGYKTDFDSLQSRTQYPRHRDFETPVYEEIRASDVISFRLLMLGRIHRLLVNLPREIFEAGFKGRYADEFVFGTNPDASPVQELIAASKDRDAIILLQQMQRDFADRKISKDSKLEQTAREVDGSISQLINVLELGL